MLVFVSFCSAGIHFKVLTVEINHTLSCLQTRVLEVSLVLLLQQVPMLRGTFDILELISLYSLQVSKTSVANVRNFSTNWIFYIAGITFVWCCKHPLITVHSIGHRFGCNVLYCCAKAVLVVIALVIYCTGTVVFDTVLY